MAKDIRGKVTKLLRKKKLEQWTIIDVSETALSKTQLSNCFHHMSKAGLIEDTGKLHGNMKIWTWPVQPEEDSSFHTIGEQIVAIMRLQDSQIAHDTQVIKELTQQVAELRLKNKALSEKLNEVTGGRVTSRELAAMSKRSTLQ